MSWDQRLLRPSCRHRPDDRRSRTPAIGRLRSRAAATRRYLHLSGAGRSRSARGRPQRPVSTQLPSLPQLRASARFGQTPAMGWPLRASPADDHRRRPPGTRCRLIPRKPGFVRDLAHAPCSRHDARCLRDVPGLGLERIGHEGNTRLQTLASSQRCPVGRHRASLLSISRLQRPRD